MTKIPLPKTKGMQDIPSVAYGKKASFKIFEIGVLNSHRVSTGDTEIPLTLTTYVFTIVDPSGALHQMSIKDWGGGTLAALQNASNNCVGKPVTIQKYNGTVSLVNHNAKNDHGSLAVDSVNWNSNHLPQDKIPLLFPKRSASR